MQNHILLIVSKFYTLSKCTCRLPLSREECHTAPSLGLGSLPCTWPIYQTVANHSFTGEYYADGKQIIAHVMFVSSRTSLLVRMSVLLICSNICLSTICALIPRMRQQLMKIHNLVTLFVGIGAKTSSQLAHNLGFWLNNQL